MESRKVVLTGDRPTGKLHLGHYVGSLLNRVDLQDNPEYEQFVMIADVQALSANYKYPGRVRENVFEVALDYLASGLDPAKTTFFIQSQIPQIAELTVFYLNLVTVNRLKRNPTVKEESKAKGFGENIPAGFLVHPINQAADITVVKGEIVPVGEDQLPLIEQTNEVIRSFNRTYRKEVFPEVKAVISKSGCRLPGIDGRAKMSKSLNNAIFLADPKEVVSEKVYKMYTDPGHIRVSDPGKVEGNMVFTYMDIFDPDKQEVAKLKEQYKKGGLGDMQLKKRLSEILNSILEPISKRRKELEKEPDYVMDILRKGTEKTLERAEKTMAEVKKVMYLNHFVET